MKAKRQELAELVSISMDWGLSALARIETCRGAFSDRPHYFFAVGVLHDDRRIRRRSPAPRRFRVAGPSGSTGAHPFGATAPLVAKEPRAAANPLTPRPSARAARHI